MLFAVKTSVKLKKYYVYISKINTTEIEGAVDLFMYYAFVIFE